MPLVGVWYHAMCVFDGSTMRLYVNGVLQADAVSYPSGLAVGTSPMKIGVFYTDNNLPLDGGIDDVRVYNRALSAAEVTQLYTTNNTTLSRVTQLNFGMQTYTAA
jgi:large repetitive protein